MDGGLLLLITGAGGVGKSTVRALVEPQLPREVECAELLDLTPRPAATTLRWRQQTAELAVRRALALRASGRHLLLAGDPVAAAEIVAAPSAPGLHALAACLLDASAQAQAERLAARGEPAALLPHHRAFADWMRAQAQDPLHMPHVVANGGWDRMRWERLEQLAGGWRMHTIDTTAMSGHEVAAAVLDWCRRALAGEAPVISLGRPPQALRRESAAPTAS